MAGITDPTYVTWKNDMVNSQRTENLREDSYAFVKKVEAARKEPDVYKAVSLRQDLVREFRSRNPSYENQSDEFVLNEGMGINPNKFSGG